MRRPGPAWKASLRHGVERLGFGSRDAARSMWLHGASADAFSAAAGLVDELTHGRSDVALVATASDRAAVDELRARYPDDVVVAAPHPSAGSLDRFLARLRPCALLLLGSGASLAPATLARVAAAGLPIRRVDDPGGADAASLRALLPPAPSCEAAAPTWHVPSLRDRAGQSRLWGSLAPLLARRRIDDFASLRERLGGPRTVLCLGNGPSSEDPRLGSVDHDCLIRVNWRWRERGFLTRPDVVFVGDAATIHKAPPCIFGLWSERLERAMLLRHLVTRGLAPIEYFTVERLTPLAAETRWPARPSNGALAILTAAALAPQRLVIAGIDLFAHPAGRYPGAPLARNEYAPSHRLDVELEIIELALAGYAGEVVILSDILREHLEARRGQARRGA
ncbi:MAG: glycosyltransferase N-terminal domain-containing protein [Burkholderiales bacterium]